MIAGYTFYSRQPVFAAENPAELAKNPSNQPVELWNNFITALKRGGSEPSAEELEEMKEALRIWWSQSGQNANVCDAWGRTPLSHIAENGCVDMAVYFEELVG